MTGQGATSGWPTRMTLAALFGCLALLSACGGSGPAATATPTTGPTTSGSTVVSTTSARAAPSTSSTTAANAAAPPVATASATTPAASAPVGVGDGTYRLAVNPNCGEVQFDGAALVVRGNAVTVQAVSGGNPVPGTIDRQGSGFHIHAAIGTSVVIDLTGSADANGALTGKGKSAGIHPSGETGWACDFAFTADPATAASAGGAGQTVSVNEFRSPTGNISCELNYHHDVTDDVRCQTFSPMQSVTMSTTGAFTTCTGNDCVGNPGEGTPTLAYGQTTVIGPFTCMSASGGVTCSAAGKGFQISSAGVKKIP